MYVERKLNLWIEKLFLQWKGVGKVMYLPLLINYIILPLFCIICGKSSITYDEHYYFIEYGFYFIPFLSVWWILMVLQEYMEGIGHEVIWIYDRHKFIDILTYFILYVIAMIPLFLWVHKYWLIDNSTIILLLSQSFLYFGITYFMIFTFHSILTAIVPIFAYTLFSDTLLSNLIDTLKIYDFRNTRGYLFIGICLLILGFVRRQKESF
jgi:hypothetical protein